MAINTAFRGRRIREFIKSAGDSELDAHVELGVIYEGGHWWVSCTVCGGRWSVEFSQVDTGDGYCVEGATNYYGSGGRLVKRL